MAPTSALKVHAEGIGMCMLDQRTPFPTTPGFEVLADCLDPFLTAITSDLNPLTGPSAGLPDAPWQRRMAAMLAAPAPGPAGFASYDVRAPETAPKAAPAPDLSAATAAGGGARQVQTAPAPVTVDAFQPSLAVQVLPLGR